jgi:hypothetical protein
VNTNPARPTTRAASVRFAGVTAGTLLFDLDWHQKRRLADEGAERRKENRAERRAEKKRLAMKVRKSR